MEFEIINALLNYIDTISSVGYLNSKQTLNLKLLYFLYSIISDSLFDITACEEHKVIVNKLYECLTTNSVLYECVQCAE